MSWISEQGTKEEYARTHGLTAVMASWNYGHNRVYK